LGPNEIEGEQEGDECCSEVVDEDVEPSDYEVTSDGKYRCRDCGMLFDTLEEHDDHHRSVHAQAETYLKQGMTM
jgi:transposase-like protein